MSENLLNEFEHRGPHEPRLTFRSYYCIYYPADLKTSDKTYSPILWANGTLGFPLAYDGILRHLASWGYVVIASWSPMTMIDQIQFNGGVKISRYLNKSDRLFKGKLLLENMGACGHSQGGAVALSLSKFRNVKATVALQPAPVDCSKSKHPILMITGGWDFIVRPSMVYGSSFKTAANVTSCWLQHKTATHLMPLMTAGDMRAPTTAFFQWHLNKNESAEKCFEEDNHLYNDTETWQFERVNGSSNSSKNGPLSLAS